MSGGDLLYHLNRRVKFEENEARYVIASVLLALKHVHGCGIIHRDLKVDNIAFDEYGYVKLLDYSISIVKQAEDETMISTAERKKMKSGTLNSMAPEILSSLDYSYTSDFYSLGVVLF